MSNRQTQSNRRPKAGGRRTRRSAARPDKHSDKQDSKRKRRPRPIARALKRRSKISRNPLPKAASRASSTAKPSVHATRPGSPPAASHELEGSSDYQLEMQHIQAQFARLESAAQLPDIYNTIGEIDHQLVQLPIDLERLRTRGYVHSGHLEDQLEALDDRWDKIRAQIENALQSHARELDQEMDQVERQLSRITRRVNASTVKTAENAVEQLDNQIDTARSAVSGLYDDIEMELDRIAYQIRRYSQMLDSIDDSPSIKMREAEAPLLLVEAEWQKDGDEGPDGILLLTDQRLLFEQREEVVTKRRFGLFKAESEMVQKLQLDISVHDIQKVEHERTGGFLGMGKDDMMRIVCKATAPLSRANFHLKGQRSEEWASMIKLVQTGDIDEQRADEYEEEVGLAEETAAAFPDSCPNCFANVPVQPRGIVAYTCNFCAAVIEPSLDDADSS